MGEAAARTAAIQRATTYDLERLRSFSDCVFAVAITIIVVNLHVPNPVTEPSLYEHLAREWPRYLSFLAGFAVIGYLWLSHHRTFELIAKADATLVWLNLGFLLLVVFLPFPTLLFSEYRLLPPAVAFFAVSVVCVGTANALLWFYVTRHHRLVGAGLTDQALRVYRARSLVYPSVFALSLVVLATIGPGAAVITWLLLLPGRAIVKALLGDIPSGEGVAEANEPDTEIADELRGVLSRHDASATELTGYFRARGSRARLLSFSDNVYAFAITLLVLRFTLPEEPDSVVTSAQFVAYLQKQLDADLVAYVIGFVVIGLFWDLHHRTMLLLERQNGAVRLLNLIHLSSVALLPWATLLLATFSDSTTAVTVYAFVAGIVGATMAVLTDYLTASRRHLIDPALPRSWVHVRRRAIWFAPIGFFAASALAHWLGVWSQVLWFAPFFAVRIYQRNRLAALLQQW